MMEDKEVGELWNDPLLGVGPIRNLIRKLVEERAWNVAKEYCDRAERAKMLSCVNAALRDFGIDPETWNP